MDYKLIIFDLDGTLADRDTGNLLPGVRDWKEATDGKRPHIAVATNQGGVGLRYWMEEGEFGEPEKFPTAEDIKQRLENVDYQLGIPNVLYLKCFRYQSKTSGKWNPVPEDEQFKSQWSIYWRKPSPGMLIHAMIWADASSSETLMVGDGFEDRLAAENAGCAFRHADQFFGPYRLQNDGPDDLELERLRMRRVDE